MEHILEDINSRQSEEWMMLKHPSTDLANRFRKSLTDSLSSPLADLNATIRAFTQGVQGNSHNAKLMEAVQTLTVGLRDAQMTQERACMNFEHLVGTVSDLLAYQQTRSAQGMVKLWPRPYPNWKETEVNNKAPESTPVLMRTAVSKPWQDETLEISQQWRGDCNDRGHRLDDLVRHYLHSLADGLHQQFLRSCGGGRKKSGEC